MVKPKSTAPFDKKMFFLFFVGLSFFEAVLFVIFFKYVKNNLTPELVDPIERTVGFVHYANYPYYLDTIAYILLLIVPVVILGTIKFFYKK